MSERHDDHDQNVVSDNVDDSVVAYAYPQPVSPLQSSGTRGSGIFAQQGDGPLDSLADR